jgi:cell wall-associated NlpC family hydrolase
LTRRNRLCALSGALLFGMASPALAQEAPTAPSPFARVDLQPTIASRAAPFAAISATASALRDSLLARARGQLGTRYVLGGEKPGVALDCSSFARYVMEAINMRLPRTAAQQARIGQEVPTDARRLRPGDLLTFGKGRTISHVGIYTGEGRFIHASVKSGKIIETSFARNGELLRRWKGVRRLFAGADSAEISGAS